MIKFGNINVNGVLFGDTPITTIYKGLDKVFSSGTKYPANSIVVRFAQLNLYNTLGGDVYGNIPFNLYEYSNIPCTVDWGDGSPIEEYDGSLSIPQHTYRDMWAGQYYDAIFTLKDNVKRNYHFGDYILLVLHSPENKTVRYWNSDRYGITMNHFRVIRDPNVDPTQSAWIGMKQFSTDYSALSTDTTLTIGDFPSDGFRLDIGGMCEKIVCEEDFKPVNPSGNRFLINLKNGDRVTEITGLNTRDIKQARSIVNIEEYPHRNLFKVNNLKIGTFTNIKAVVISGFVDYLVYLDIRNLGEFAIQDQTYDFSKIVAWGDETKAAELGVQGARQSLIDTLVNNSFDVNGKNVTLKFSPETLARLTQPMIDTLHNKGYKIDGIDLNPNNIYLKGGNDGGEEIHNLFYEPNVPNLGVPFKVDWGDGTAIAASNGHTYAESPGKRYTIEVMPDSIPSNGKWVSSYWQNKYSGLKEILQVPAYVKHISLADYGDAYYDKDIRPHLDVLKNKLNAGMNVYIKTHKSSVNTNKDLIIDNVWGEVTIQLYGEYKKVILEKDFRWNTLSLGNSTYNNILLQVHPDVYALMTEEEKTKLKNNNFTIEVKA